MLVHLQPIICNGVIQKNGENIQGSVPSRCVRIQNILPNGPLVALDSSHRIRRREVLLLCL